MIEMICEQKQVDAKVCGDKRFNTAARWWHLKIENNIGIVQRCFGFIESIKNLEFDETIVPEPVELKWKGIKPNNVVLFAGQERCLDAFYVYHDSPSVVYLGVDNFAVDYEGFRNDYVLHGPGEWEIVYTVCCESGDRVGKTFYLKVGERIEDIIFTECPFS